MVAPSKVLALLVTTLVALGPLSTDLYLPSLPVLAREFGRDEAAVQLTLSVFLAGFGLAQLAYGPLSDRYGRRPVMLAALAIYLVASLACMLAPNIEALVAARLAQALGACAGPVIGRAIVRDLYGPHEAARVMAYISGAMAVAPMLGPLLGGFLTVWFGWRANFAALSLFSALQIVAVAWLLVETNAGRDPSAMVPARIAANYARLAASPRYLGYLACSTAAYAGLFSFISGSSFVLIDTYGMSPQAYGASFGLVVTGYIAGALVSGRHAVRLGPRRMLRAGASLAAAAGSLMVVLAAAGAGGVWGVLVPMAAFTLATGLVMPSAIAGALAPYPEMAGAASALMGFVQMSLAALVGIAVAAAHDGSAVPMAGAIALCGWAALASWLAWVRRVG